ncbi:hypothetical protein B4092_3359 [Bacillus licheniformis]|nr:hypothetical protein B4092_3359 [Bacillus licheniformis]TWJ68692.1 hypothetical protein CHCC5020_4286 [Bacillus licheniformis]TWN51774.1 hypothetical protein CHCC14441_3976 [Bacillus licheniformis]TWN51955.1 hypothetical protein CHCC14437_2275 [Bacillus licheniformis]TWO01756.1 hypothetical protein CHCC20486_2155 [Bacillus licheniformis]
MDGFARKSGCTNHQRCAEEEDARIYYEEMAADLLDFKMSSLEVQP